MKLRITWDAELFGVKIETEKEAFVISAKPSMQMSWDDAMKFFQDDKVWRLPNVEQLVLVEEHISEINDIIMANGGYIIEGWFWSAEDYYDNLYVEAWAVSMCTCEPILDELSTFNSVRPISILS